QEVSEDPADDGYTLTVEVGGEVHSGAYDGASWIDFTGVPAGPFVLRTKSPPSPALPGLPGGQSFTETALRELFVGRTFSGRAEVALTTDAATSIALTVESMTPFGDADLFELYSYNADAWRPVDPLEG